MSDALMTGGKRLSKFALGFILGRRCRRPRDIGVGYRLGWWQVGMP